jgi:hypothetical protein
MRVWGPLWDNFLLCRYNYVGLVISRFFDNEAPIIDIYDSWATVLECSE